MASTAGQALPRLWPQVQEKQSRNNRAGACLFCYVWTSATSVGISGTGGWFLGTSQTLAVQVYPKKGRSWVCNGAKIRADSAAMLQMDMAVPEAHIDRKTSEVWAEKER